MINMPLKPKNPDGVLRVIILGRVSTLHQNMRNIEASYEAVEKTLRDIWKGPVQIKQFGEQASGMLTDRRAIVAASEEIATGAWDLVLMEDVSRSYRNPRWIYAFVQDCVDLDTRVIAPGDDLDTANECWEVTLGAAALRHGLHIPDTRRRVRRTATHAFHAGGMVAKVCFGYRKLSAEEAASGEFGPKGLRIAKLPECTPILQQIRDKILAGETYAGVARWLNREGIPTAPYVRNGWTGKLVATLLRDPILSGTRQFRALIYDPIFKTGKHRRKNNPHGPETEHYPELAHFSQAEHAELITHMDARKCDGQRTGQESPRHGVARSDSIWPAQHASCSICCGIMYRTLSDQLKCQNAFARVNERCWNHVQFSAGQARQKILPWLIGIIEQHPECREILVNSLWDEYKGAMRLNQHSQQLHAERIVELERRGKNLAEAIGDQGGSEILMTQLAAVEKELKQARRCRDEEVKRQEETRPICSREDVAAQWKELIIRLAEESFEFAALMRRIIPVFDIVPVQALDSGLVRPRARVTLRLSNLLGPEQMATVNPQSDDIEAEFDLFDPPLHIKFLQGCADKKTQAPKSSYREIGKQLDIGYMTVKRAFAYLRLMHEAGMTEPYRVLTYEPEQASRWR